MSRFSEDSVGDYRTFLEALIANNYQAIFFSELSAPQRQMVLRHDIDFDCELAWQMAKIEEEMGLKATYFFLVASDSYNLLSEKNAGYVRAIHAMGHCVSIHFDPLIYTDYAAGLAREQQIFEAFFDAPVTIISLHRPNLFFQQHNQAIGKIEHTYQQKYFADVKYFADSTGRWRFGHPFNSPEFAAQASLHLLIHPIWWMTTGADNYEKIKTSYQRRVQQLKEHYRYHCKPFGEIYETV